MIESRNIVRKLLFIILNLKKNQINRRHSSDELIKCRIRPLTGRPQSNAFTVSIRFLDNKPKKMK